MNKNISKKLSPSACLIFLGSLTVSPGAMSADTLTIYAEADTNIRTDLNVRRNDNYGCEPIFVIGTSRGGGGIPFGGPDAMRSLLRFDTTGLTSAGLNSALMELTLFGFDNGLPTSIYTVDVHRVVDSGLLTPWIEGNGGGGLPGCTGTDPAFGVAWVGAGDGGDANNQTQPSFDSTIEASATVDQAVNTRGDVISWDITPLTRSWIDGTIANYGIFLTDVTFDGSFRGVRFASREGIPTGPPYDLAAPRLVLTYLPTLSCSGFEPPVDDPMSPVQVKNRHRALPFKAEVLDADGNPVFDTGLSSPPVIQVVYAAGTPDAQDVGDQTVAAGLGTEGNEFEFAGGKWQFNLKLKNFDAPGTYTVTMEAGETYAIDPTCTAQFVIS